MERLMTAEESYVDRRRLFRDIWATAMNIDVKNTEFLNKPKVIKTLRLDSIACFGGKKKKHKIRNLRTVCNKILDFCDKQDVDDLINTQMTMAGHIPPRKTGMAAKNQKIKLKNKMRKSKSTFSPNTESSPAKATTSERKDQISFNFEKTTTQNTSPIKLKPTVIMKMPMISNKASANVIETSTMKMKAEAPRRKFVKKIIIKRKRHAII